MRVSSELSAEPIGAANPALALRWQVTRPGSGALSRGAKFQFEQLKPLPNCSLRHQTCPRRSAN